MALERSKGPIVYALQKYDFLMLFPIPPSMLAKYRQAQKRTNVSLDATLVTLLALKLDHLPGSSQAHHAIRQWLQQRLDELNDPGLYQVSQWLPSQVVLALVDNPIALS